MSYADDGYDGGDPFHGPPLAVQQRGGGRAYRHPETGELHVSITTAIKVLDKPALVGWAARETAAAAWEQREALVRMDRGTAIDALKNARYRSMDRAGLRGSSIHRVCEALARDEPLPTFGPDEVPYIDAFLAFVSAFGPVFEVVEGTVFSDRFGYAGTFDFLAVIGGLVILGDHKTGKGVYPEVALQLAAARYADRIWDRETGELRPMPEIDGAIVVHLQPDGYRVVEIEADLRAHAAFVACVNLVPWVHDEAAAAVGPSLSPARLARSFARAEP